MDRVVNKPRDHDEARAWDIQQNASMTPEQRLRAARTLKDRAFPSDAKDVRDCHRSGDTEIPIRYIGLEALVKNKQATGRPKDLDDASYLVRKL